MKETNTVALFFGIALLCSAIGIFTLEHEVKLSEARMTNDEAILQNHHDAIERIDTKLGL